MGKTGKALLYWIPTILVALNAAFGGVIDAMRTPEALKIFQHLGYPNYFATLLGIAKVLGAIALIAPVPWTLREWAYAGLTFDVISAVISIAAVGDPIANEILPILFVALTLVSFAAWRKRIGLPIMTLRPL